MFCGVEIKLRRRWILLLGIVIDFAFWKCLGLEVISDDLVHIKSINSRRSVSDGDAATGLFVGL